MRGVTNLTVKFTKAGRFMNKLNRTQVKSKKAGKLW